MGDINKFCDLMRYWCDEGNLGYSQENRWNIYYGGECDCSSLVIHCLQIAGFNTGEASWTGNMSDELCARGWKRVMANGRPKKGDLLLNDQHHVAAWLGDCLAQASIDENGNTRGGKPGDQTGRETYTRSYYEYSRGWDCYLRYAGAESGNNGGGLDMAKLGIIRNGSTGETVKTLQILLNEKDGAGLEVDGECGILTEFAIRDWQIGHDLEIDGECGINTWSSILGLV